MAAIAVLLLLGLVSLPALEHLFGDEVWTREQPLVDPIGVTEVRSGELVLNDGRVVRPAGVRRADSISPEEYDFALRVVAAQGVVIRGDLGDGRAMLTAEPRFYNWCGTRGYRGNPFAHWAGSFIQCPVSEFMIHAGYAEADTEQPGLSVREQWRLEGAGEIARSFDLPLSARGETMAFRYEGSERMFTDYETWLEVSWMPPPDE